MKTIIVKTQKEFNLINNNLTDFTVIKIRSTELIIVTCKKNSHVEAWGNSHVEAWENSHVEAWENSRVEAFDFATILVSSFLSLKLYKYSTAFLKEKLKNKIEKKSKTANIIDQSELKLSYTRKDFFNLCETQNSKIVLYKIVKDDLTDFYTGKIKYENEVVCPDFNPDKNIERGKALHLSRTILEAKSYQATGIVLKCLVDKKDIVVYPKNITKVRCRRVFVEGRV